MLTVAAVVFHMVLPTHKNVVLLGQRAKKDDGYGLWCLPGGKLEEGEHAEAAAIRELYEETQIVLDKKDIRPIHFAHKQEKDREFVMLYYAHSEFLSIPLTFFYPPEEFLDMQWFDVRELPTAQMWQEDVDAVLLTLAKPIYSFYEHKDKK